MASIIVLLVLLTTLYPIGCAAWANRKTTLFYALFWALAAWLAWTGSIGLVALKKESEAGWLHYLALGLTGCASVAVLGARRPGVGAWNFVILGLLAVMLFLWLEGRLAEDDLILLRVRTVFLAGTVAVGVLNYLPTRLAPAAVLLALGYGLEIFNLIGMKQPALNFEATQTMAGMMMALTPWVAYSRLHRQPKILSEFDQIWLRFRDSYGLVWAQRLREQFNQSAKHSDWPVVLRWQGLRLLPRAVPPSHDDRQAMLTNLRGLMKRFWLDQEN